MTRDLERTTVSVRLPAELLAPHAVAVTERAALIGSACNAGVGLGPVQALGRRTTVPTAAEAVSGSP